MEVSNSQRLLLSTLAKSNSDASVWRERLSSSLRINWASDDPSGLYLAKYAEANTRGTRMAINNVQDGISLIHTIDSGLNEIQQMLFRIRDLAVRAANEATLKATCQDRTKLNNEAQTLIDEIDRQAAAVTFNTKPILQGNTVQSVTTANTTTVVSGANLSSPGWDDSGTIIYSSTVSGTGAQTGSKPGNVDPGDINRIFSIAIDEATNATAGPATQLTSDPFVLSDVEGGVGDGYFDTTGAGTFNDPLNFWVSPTEGPAGPDLDGDGWNAALDNDDNDATETGTGLNSLAPDTIISTTGVDYAMDPTLITMENAFARSFSTSIIDNVDVSVTAGVNYAVQAFDVNAGAWVTVGGPQTGNGGIQNISFGSDITSNEVRVVLDDPETDATSGVSIGNTSLHTVDMDTGAANAFPMTYEIALAEGLSAINRVSLDYTAGMAYDLYYEDGAGTTHLLHSGVGGATYNYAGATINATKFWVETNSGGSVTNFSASNTYNTPCSWPHTAMGGDVYRVDFTDGAATISSFHINNVLPGSWVYTSFPIGAPFASSAAEDATYDLSAAGDISSIYVRLNPTDSLGPCTAVATETYTDLAPVAYPRTVTFTFDDANDELNEIQINVANGLNYEIYDDTGTNLLASGTGDGTIQTYSLGSTVTSDSLIIQFDPGTGTLADINSLTATNTITLGATSTSFVDLDGDNRNIATYTLDTSGGNAAERFDQMDITVALGEVFSVYTSDDGVTWTAAATNQTGTGANQTLSFASEQLVDADADGTGYVRIAVHSGMEIDSAIIADPVFTNSVDRDGDGFPDVIEQQWSSNAGNAGSVPSWSTSGHPDQDNDGIVDSNSYDRLWQAGYLASNNPYGADWDGSGTRTGNPLDAPGGQYANPGDEIDPTQVPSNIDTDGDTLPDPLDPFPNTAEWATWRDGDASFRGGVSVFTSNRSTPDSARQDVYLVNGTSYQLLATDPNGDASNVVTSWDGNAVAWESGGGLYAITLSGSAGCTGAAAGATPPVLIAASGANASISNDGTQVVFDDGGQLYTTSIDGGGATALNVNGTNADWSPNGDNLVYERGGNLYMYNFVTEEEFDLGLAGSNATWSPNGDKIAYLDAGGNICVSDVQITMNPQKLQIAGADNASKFQLDIDIPDARSQALGIAGITLLTNTGAGNAITNVDNAINEISTLRAKLGATEKLLNNILDELNNYAVNSESFRSSLADTDYALAISHLTRSQIISNSSLAMLAYADTELQQTTYNLLSENFNVGR